MEKPIILDHLAVAAETLEEGRAAVENALGVSLLPGGQHAHFATHNMLLGLEDGLYLEVIAADPSAPKPGYPRWFDLDRFSGGPRLSNWICRVPDLGQMVKRLPQSGLPVALARGDLRWQMAVPSDGILPYDNCFPALIEWQSRPHPATRLAASGCRLRRLTIRHPEANALRAELAAYFDDDRVCFETGGQAMQAEFDTPHGARLLA